MRSLLFDGCRLSRTWVVALLAMTTVLVQAPARAGYAEDMLRKEAAYLVDSSYTRWAQNKATHDWQADAYGALNNVRLTSSGADWVRPSENAVAIIGLMQATRKLREAGFGVTDEEAVLNEFFDNWLKWKRQPIVASGVDAGGVVDEMSYDAAGARVSIGEANTGSTGILMVAMYKRYEFLRDTGRGVEAQAWLDNPDAWRIMNDGYAFIQRNLNTTHKMVYSRSGQTDLWLTDSVLAACGLKCFSQWAARSGRSSGTGGATANQLVQGVNGMRDTGGWKNFYRLREAGNNLNPGYGDRIDQICHLPYESGLLNAGETFARDISNWWTAGSSGSPRMTYQTNRSGNWRYYGTRWKFFFNGSPASNNYLYPGPALQLAKMEWRTGRALNDGSLTTRANHRFGFANNTSNLWLGETSASEANVPNGIVDWRDATSYNNKAADYLRFIDTSSYMIQVCLMVFFDRDTSYLPQ